MLDSRYLFDLKLVIKFDLICEIFRWIMERTEIIIRVFRPPNYTGKFKDSLKDIHTKCVYFLEWVFCGVWSKQTRLAGVVGGRGWKGWDGRIPWSKTFCVHISNESLCFIDFLGKPTFTFISTLFYCYIFSFWLSYQFLFLGTMALLTLFGMVGFLVYLR